jgi:biotin transport system substrate-specific component
MPKSTAAPRLRALDMAYAALAAVLIAVCAWASVPLPKPFVPFTMQTFGVFAALMCLGGRRGLYGVAVYLLLGAIGLPVFSGFRGGAGVLFDATGGYLVGFIALALIYWALTAKLGDALPVKIAACAAGLTVCYAFGTAWFVVLYASSHEAIGVMTALGWCVFPFLLPDAVKLCLAAALGRRVSALVK